MVNVAEGRTRRRHLFGLAALAAVVAAPLLGTGSAAAGSAPATSQAGIVKDGAICILVKSTADKRALVLNSGAEVQAKDCRVHVRSAQTPAAVFNAASTLAAKQTCVAGRSVIRNQGLVDNLATACKASRDPYAPLIPQLTVDDCTYRGVPRNQRVITLKPGTYCGSMQFNRARHVRLKPGVYVIKDGDWIVNGGRFRGKGVTIYFEDSSRIQFNSGVSIALSAPTSGPTKNILFAEKKGLKPSRIVFNDVKRNVMNGLVYLPSRNLIFNRGGNLTSTDMAMVVNTLLLNEVKWSIAPFGPK